MIVSDSVVRKKRKRQISKYIYRFKLNNSKETETSIFYDKEYISNNKNLKKTETNTSKYNMIHEEDKNQVQSISKNESFDDFGVAKICNHYENSSFNNLRLPPFRDSRTINITKLPSIHQFLDQCGIGF